MSHNARRRDVWIDERHRAARGVDWRAVEFEDRRELWLRPQARASQRGSSASNGGTARSDLGPSDLTGTARVTVSNPAHDEVHLGTTNGAFKTVAGPRPMDTAA